MSNYKQELEKQLEALKKDLKQAQIDIHHITNDNVKWHEAISEINSISVNIATVKSRIKNLNKRVFLPDLKAVEQISNHLNSK